MNDSDRALIDAYIAEHGVTKCPPCKHSDSDDYIYLDSGQSGSRRPGIYRKDGRNSFYDFGKAALRNSIRGERIKRAEQFGQMRAQDGESK